MTKTNARRARVERKTRESDIVVELDLDGTGKVEIHTGVPFFDHMLTALGTHASFDLSVSARGDVEILAEAVRRMWLQLQPDFRTCPVALAKGVVPR